MPLPPYIKRPDTTSDRERYQTVFAEVKGSVAAPTAGLHFTANCSRRSRGRRGSDLITLHVGYGLQTGPKRGRRRARRGSRALRNRGVRRGLDHRARQEARRVVAVGTTTTRALEDSALRGGGKVTAGAADATTFIYPGFRFQVVDVLMTNFHVPRSSLLMLVSAFAGRETVLGAYREAIANRYRFYSYGDAMLIL